MNIHEYQAKALLRSYGIPVSDGRVVLRAEEAKTAAAELDELIGNAQSLSVEDLHRKPAGHVYFLEIPALQIASSELRARLAAGHDIRHLVPDAVHQIITQRGLY